MPQISSRNGISSAPDRTLFMTPCPWSLMPSEATRSAGRYLSKPEVHELEARVVPAISIRFDYTYDTSGFFNVAERRAALEIAAQQIAPRLQDTLDAITPSGNNTWRTSFYNPTTNVTVTQENPVLRQDEIVVYIGATPLTNELGLTTSGGFSAVGTRDWLDRATSRGQVGALTTPKTDFATWGGMITFNSTANWNFSSGRPTAQQFDFTSVALHELMHVYGFGLGEAAFTRHIVNGSFAGPNLLSVNGSPVKVEGNPADHFAQGTTFNGAESPMQPALPAGVKRGLTALDYAVLQDLGWNVSGAAGRSPVAVPIAVSPTPVVPTTTVSAPLALGRFAVGTANAAVVYGANGEVLRSAQPFGPNYNGGVRVATADVTGDGAPDLIVGNGPGSPAVLALLDGMTFQVIAVASPFESQFVGGIFVASADVTGDGRADVVVTADQSGGPVVVLYDGAALARGQVVQLNRFFGLNDPKFRGGLRPALGDVNGDGKPDLIVSAGFGGGPRIALWDGRTLTSAAPASIAPDFFAFETSLRNGAYVAVSDVDGDGFADVIAGAGPGGGPRVTVYSGKQLLGGIRTPIANFFAGNINVRTGVRVAATDIDSDGRADVLAATETSAVVYAPRDLLRGIAPPAWLTLSAPGNASKDGITIG